MQTNRLHAGPRPRERALSLIAAVLTAASLLTAAVAPALAAPHAELTVEMRGDDMLVQAHADVAANLDIVWATLADYDRLGDFIPSMSSSRTVSRSGSEAIVEQQGRASLGPFQRSFAVRLVVQETFQQSIRAQLIGGDFKHFSSRYEIEPLGPERTRIRYRARLAPDLPLPSALSAPIMRPIIRAQFEALLKEVERRAQG